MLPVIAEEERATATGEVPDEDHQRQRPASAREPNEHVRYEAREPNDALLVPIRPAGAQLHEICGQYVQTGQRSLVGVESERAAPVC